MNARSSLVRRRASLFLSMVGALAALELFASCGGGGWNHVVVPTETTSSAECVSECLSKDPGKRYKCYTKCPGGRVTVATSCDAALATLRADGWSYAGSYQCESSK